MPDNLHARMPNGQPWTTIEERDAIVRNSAATRTIQADPRYQQAIANKQETRFYVDVPNQGRLWIHIDKDGKVTQSNTSRTKQFLMTAPTFIPGAAGVISNIGGPAATAAVSAPSGGAPAAAVPAATAGGGSVLGGAATAGAGGAAGAGSGFSWGRLAPALLNIGGNLIGSAVQSRAAGKAADQQEASAREALALQERIFNQQQANQAPFLALGTGAATRLNTLMTPTNQRGAGPLTSLGSTPSAPQQPPAMVQMKAPDGSVRPIPADQVAHYTQMGAQVIR